MNKYTYVVEIDLYRECIEGVNETKGGMRIKSASCPLDEPTRVTRDTCLALEPKVKVLDGVGEFSVAVLDKAIRHQTAQPTDDARVFRIWQSRTAAIPLL